MGFFITSQNKYYEGDRANINDIEVTQRPSRFYDWNGSAWIFNLDIYKQKKILQLDEVFSEWFKFKRTLSPQNIRDAYWDGVDDINAGTSQSEVDTAYDNTIGGLF